MCRIWESNEINCGISVVILVFRPLFLFQQQAYVFTTSLNPSGPTTTFTRVISHYKLCQSAKKTASKDDINSFFGALQKKDFIDESEERN